MTKALNWIKTTTGHLLLDGDGNHVVFIAERKDHKGKTEYWVHKQLNNEGHGKLALNPFCAPIDQKYAIYGHITVAKQAGYRIALNTDNEGGHDND